MHTNYASKHWVMVGLFKFYLNNEPTRHVGRLFDTYVHYPLSNELKLIGPTYATLRYR